MKIGLDAFSAVGRSGNSTYSREMIRHLIRQEANHHFDLFEYVHDLFRPQFTSVAQNYDEVHVRLSASYFPLPRLEEINDLLLRERSRMRGVELFHFTNPLNTIIGPYKRVITIHDLAFLHDPSWAKAGPSAVFKGKLPGILSADALIAVSEFTKRDLIERFALDPAKIHVVYEGAGEAFYPDPDKESELVAAGSYLLCVGQLQPRKNNLALIESFGSIQNQFPDLRLVFAGRSVSPEYLDSLKSAVSEVGVEGRVVFEHNADNALLRKLYTNAECLVYPSLFEGFGLQILESFQCGTPVITSTTSSLPEVAGDAGLLVNPYSVESIALGIQRFLSDPSLRGELRKNIPAQLAKFSWDKAARETIKVYESLA